MLRPVQTSSPARREVSGAAAVTSAFFDDTCGNFIVMAEQSA
jgi:hypothetical protein